MEEASADIHAAETEAQQCHQEFLHLKQEHKKEMDFAIGRVVEQYKVQLTFCPGQPAELGSWA